MPYNIGLEWQYSDTTIDTKARLHVWRDKAEVGYLEDHMHTSA
jgi:hypothetical protein